MTDLPGGHASTVFSSSDNFECFIHYSELWFSLLTHYILLCLPRGNALTAMGKFNITVLPNKKKRKGLTAD